MTGSIWLAAGTLSLMLGTVAVQENVCQVPNGKDGYSGIKGLNGRTGQKGDRGEPGLPARRTGIRGPKGDKGESGPPGKPGNQGYRGPNGPPGHSGEIGKKGAKGKAGNIKEQPRPAFSASRKNPQAQGNIMVFDSIITNSDTPYSAQTGKFTCRVPGFYYFTFQVVSISNLCLSIMHNSTTVASFCDNNSRSNLQVNSGGSVLSLGKSDTVWLESDPQNSNKVYSGTDADSVFSGFLLFPATA
uniref:Complement C1q subcomponent subunit A n=1 Tax=Sphenodon punctatus TaxID=8508 RepID=A0A8D0LB30_SPHPU